MSKAFVKHVARSGEHGVGKDIAARIELVTGFGVRGDAHAGQTVQHRSRIRQDASQPNLRQVHLLGQEVIEELNAKGFDLAPGKLGENITTHGIELLELSRGACMHIGDAIIEVTGLRNPCAQLDGLRPGLQKALLDRDSDGGLIRRAGVMGVVRRGGWIAAGDGIDVMVPPRWEALDVV